MKRIAIIFCLGVSVNALAQQPTDTTKEKGSLLPVEVRAVRASATAPFAKTNINEKEIEQQNLGQDLPYLLRQTPSVVINSDAGNGVGYTGLYIRGIDATRINMTLNGIPFNDAESQGTYFVDLPDFASSVNNIQIQRGVGTSTNGAGAFGASINFNTNEVNKKAYAELSNSFGSFNTLKNTLKAGTGLLGNHFTTDVRLSSITSDGYVDRAFSNLKSLYFSTAYLSAKTDIRFNVLLGKEKTYQAWYGVTAEDLVTDRTKNYAGTEKPGEPYANETDNYWQNHYQLFFTQRFTPRLSFNTGLFLVKGRGYYEEYKAAQAYADYSMPSAVVSGITYDTTDLVRQLWLKNSFYGDIFSLQYQSPKTQLIWGGAVTRYEGGHFGEVTWAQYGITGGPEKYYDVPAYKNDVNFYGKWQQQLTRRLQLFTDLQYRRINYSINGFEDNPTLSVHNIYNFFNPKVGISYQAHNWLVYASYSIANKEPNRYDFEANRDQQPRPEHLGDLEAGIEYKQAKSSWGANVYYMKYKDQLVLTGKINDVGEYTRTNIPQSYRLGIELQGATTVSPWFRASANLTLSRNKVQDYTQYIDDWDNNNQKTQFYPQTDISFSPDIIGAATLSFLPVKHLTLDLMSKYVSKQYLDNTSSEDRKLDPYFVEDARATYSFSFSKKWLKNIDLIFQVYNVFNKKYVANGYTYIYYENSALVSENSYFPMAPTNVMCGVNVKL